jgi:putative aminopeptidase FrvX
MINETSRSLLLRLLQTPGPSGAEAGAAQTWREAARPYADRVYGDALDNSFALLEGGAARVLVTGHIDEIGLMVRHIDEQGFLSIAPIGNWDAQVLVGQRVRFLGFAGAVSGVVGRKPARFLTEQDRARACTLNDLWVDIGVANAADARALLDVGSVGVVDVPVVDLPGGRLVSRGLDNRIGAFIVLEALRRLAHERPAASVAVVAAAREEISSAGGAAAAFSFDPQCALVVEVTWATDHPFSDRWANGDVRLGSGPVITCGSATSQRVRERLVEIARRNNIPYSLEARPNVTYSDADTIHMARGGVAAAVVSVPLRYMHSPNEMLDLADVEHTIQLVTAFVRSVRAPTEFLPA